MSCSAMGKMSESLWNISETDLEQKKLVDMYWILCGFLDQIQKLSNEVEMLQECTYSMLDREDKELYNHLKKIESLQALPMEVWFNSCFAGTISDSSISK